MESEGKIWLGAFVFFIVLMVSGAALGGKLGELGEGLLGIIGAVVFFGGLGFLGNQLTGDDNQWYNR